MRIHAGQNEHILVEFSIGPDVGVHVQLAGLLVAGLHLQEDKVEIKLLARGRHGGI